MASKMVIYPAALQKIIETDPRCSEFVKHKAQMIVDAAKAVFNAQQRHDNEERTSENTPPKYIESFFLRKVRRPKGFSWQAVNGDPGWHFVEYGAHAGGQTFVLRYRPLGRALDIVGSVL